MVVTYVNVKLHCNTFLHSFRISACISKHFPPSVSFFLRGNFSSSDALLWFLRCATSSFFKPFWPPVSRSCSHPCNVVWMRKLKWWTSGVNVALPVSSQSFNSIATVNSRRMSLNASPKKNLKRANSFVFEESRFTTIQCLVLGKFEKRLIIQWLNHFK